MSKLCLIVILAFAIESFTNAYGIPPSPYNSKSCPNPCRFELHIVCIPFFKQPVYSIVDGQCQVWINGCYFSGENCNRRGKCLNPLVETTQEQCLKYCPQLCPEIFEPICATFPVSNENDENTFRTETFTNKCFLSRYVCQNNDPYVNEPSDGACEVIIGPKIP